MEQITVKLYSSNPHLCDEIIAEVNLDNHFPPLPAYIPLPMPTGALLLSFSLYLV